MLKTLFSGVISAVLCLVAMCLAGFIMVKVDRMRRSAKRKFREISISKGKTMSQHPAENILAARKKSKYLIEISSEEIDQIDAFVRQLKDEISQLSNDLEEATYEPWPAWAEAILRIMQKNGFDPVDEFGNANLAEAFEQFCDECEGRNITYRRQIEDLKAAIEGLKSGAQPFTTFSENVEVDEHGTPGWTSKIHRDTISTWFGPSDFHKLAEAAKKAPASPSLPKHPTIRAFNWEFNEDEWFAKTGFSGSYVIERGVQDKFLLQVPDDSCGKVAFDSLREAQESGFEDFKRRVLSMIQFPILG